MFPFDRLRSGPSASSDCRCDASFETQPGGETTVLSVDADGCPGGGDLGAAACRATVVGALAAGDAGVVRCVRDGLVSRYDGAATALLLAAGRFVERVAVYDEALAGRARRDPLAAAREATGRAGAVSRVAAETGLAEAAAAVGSYDDLGARVGPAVAGVRFERAPPTDASLRERRDLDAGPTVRVYETPEGPRYHLTPVEATLSRAATAALAAAHGRLADGASPAEAVQGVADESLPVAALADVLRKHTAGAGLLEDLFADPTVTDAFVTAPAAENPVRVVAGDERMRTNAWLTATGAAALGSRLRRESGRAFSRASPTLDATLPVRGERVRVAGVTDPASDGPGFAVRGDARESWTLPALVANETISAAAAACCSLAVERAAAGLVAGPRGAGKTTLLGALLWELPAATRTVVVEDTPELPVDALRDAGRDVQPLRATTGDGPAVTPERALRTALRLGEGALVVGEVRGEEAATLYEAMRVGATGSTVLGTVHGDGPGAVRERVVTDLGVPPSSFASTDMLVALSPPPDRGLASLVEVRSTDDGPAFEPLYGRRGDPTGVVDRGNSRLVAALAGPDEEYAAVRAALDRRATHLGRLAETGRTTPDEVTAAYRERGRSAAR
ncbi:MAG: type II secretion system protein E [uncultured archaeon A07HB70]|nr:MAG: type II secretion system protein E [uncultured archaeon A07HB70]